MKQKELKKIYKYDEEEEAYIIDVQLEDYRDAYSDWDFSPFVNRDLDDDLTEYLLECSYEIPLKMKLIINFHILKQVKSIDREARSIEGMYNYFSYNVRILKNYRMRVVKDILTYLVMGTVLLITGAFFDDMHLASIWGKVLSEGVYIGGWVMIWEMFSAWIFDIKKVRTKTKHFIRFKNTHIKYKYSK